MKISLHAAMTDPSCSARCSRPKAFGPGRRSPSCSAGIPLTEDREVDLFKSCTGRTHFLKVR